MRRVLLVSIGLHLAALVLLLALRWSAPAEPDEPARIEVVFGTSGALPPAPASAAVPAAAPTPPAAAPPTPDAAGETPELALVPAASAAPVPPAAADPGLKFARPDPQVIPAREALGNHAPDYPEEAQRLHQQGMVLLRLHIGADGAVTSVETLQSSGFVALDEAARVALAQWHFLPAQQAGRPVPSFRDQPVNFGLE
jgi:periplasmic protein TonB